MAAHLADGGLEAVGLEHRHFFERFVVAECGAVIAGVPGDGRSSEGRGFREFTRGHGQHGDVRVVGRFRLALFEVAVAEVELGFGDVQAGGVLANVFLQARDSFAAAVFEGEVGGRLEDALFDFGAVQAHRGRQVVEQAALDQQGLHDVVGVGGDVVVAVLRPDAIPKRQDLVVLSLLDPD